MPFFLIFIGIIIAVIYLGWRNEKKRTEAMGMLADELGLTFYEDDSLGLEESLQDFYLFSQGHGCKVTNILQKAGDNLEITAFDYKYTTGSGKNSSTHRQTVILFSAQSLQLPSFTLRPEGFFHKIGAVFGFSDINFDENPAFSKAYLLKGENERKVRETFTSEVLDFFNTKDGISTEGAGHQLLFYTMNKRLDPDRIEGFIKEGLTVFNTFARH